MNDPLEHNLIWEVFLPLKNFSAAKSRLAITPAELRVLLIKSMASDVIEVLLQIPSISSIKVVGVDHSQITEVKDSRLSSIPFLEPNDINSDIAQAIDNVDRYAVLLPDLPSVKAQEVIRAFELASHYERSFIADKSGVGSTAFFSTVGKVSTFFGHNSAEAHRGAGAIELKDSLFAGIKADCDVWSDLLAISSQDLCSATRALMEQHLQN